MALLETTERGLYCAAGDFYIDPWLPVRRAMITHAHSDHARAGSERYLCAAPGKQVLAERVGYDAAIDTIPYGDSLTVGEARVSFHPAGHLLGSAQIRVERAGEVWVASGDYKTEPDPTCDAIEPVRCHTFITESTFGLPIYRWPTPESLSAEINAWWRANQEQGRASVIFAYSLGKAQRLMASLDPGIGPILMHGAVSRFSAAYEAAGIKLPPAEYATVENAKLGRGRAMIVAPPSAASTPWLKKFGPLATAMASGWMQIRGARRRRSLDRGFVLSDHADWNGLLTTIAATGAERVLVTHGYTSVLARWLQEQGLEAGTLATRYEGETDEPDAASMEPVATEELVAESAGDTTPEASAPAMVEAPIEPPIVVNTEPRPRRATKRSAAAKNPIAEPKTQPAPTTTEPRQFSPNPGPMRAVRDSANRQLGLPF